MAEVLMPTNHDGGYRLLFAHRSMIQHLLRGFVPAEWVFGLVGETMARTSEIRITDRLARREQDLVWRLEREGELAYVYLLLEFQSVPDPQMGLRMGTYAGLLCQDLIRSGEWPRASEPPTVLPLVIYNGRRSWTASHGDRLFRLAPGIPPGYWRIDALRDVLPADSANLVAGLFRLERSRTPVEVERQVGVLVPLLAGPENRELRRAFAAFLRESLLPGRFPGTEVPAMADLEEVRPMLRETVIEWTQQWKAQGLAEGIKEGMSKGMKEGRRQGEAELLVRLLELRFGPLREQDLARIDNADTDQILAWGDRFVNARSLSEVFGG
jgi:predicted transposase YdaD